LNNSPHKMFSTLDVARMLGVAVSSVSKWIDEGTLTAGRTPGGHRRIEKDDLVRFLRQQKLRIPAELQTSPVRILIADDEEPFTKWLKEEIGERYPHLDVVVAHDGYSAGEMVGLAKPDVVILDLHMPGIDGFEVCRRIKANPLIKHICVIAVTADASPLVRSRILKLGACVCLVKPFDSAVVLAEITKAIGLPTL
jgi:excisionase family DNA binding protein